MALRALSTTVRFAFRTAATAARYGAKKMVHLYDAAEDRLLVQQEGKDAAADAAARPPPADVVPADANVVGMSAAALDAAGSRYRSSVEADDSKAEGKRPDQEGEDADMDAAGEGASPKADTAEAPDASKDTDGGSMAPDEAASEAAPKVEADASTTTSDTEADTPTDASLPPEPVVVAENGEEEGGGDDVPAVDSPESSVGHEPETTSRRRSIASRLRFFFDPRHAQEEADGGEAKVDEEVAKIVAVEETNSDKEEEEEEDRGVVSDEPPKSDAKAEEVVASEPVSEATAEIDEEIPAGGNEETTKEDRPLEVVASENATISVAEVNNTGAANVTNAIEEEEGSALVVDATKRKKITKILMGAKKRSKLIILALLVAVTLPHLEVVEDDAGGITGVAVAGLPRGDELWDGVRDAAARGAAGGRRGLANALSAARRARDAREDARSSAEDAYVDEVYLPPAEAMPSVDVEATASEVESPLELTIDQTTSNEDILDESKAQEVAADATKAESEAVSETENIAEASEEPAMEDTEEIEKESNKQEQEPKNDKTDPKENKDSKEKNNLSGWAAEEALKNALATKKTIIGGSTALMEPPVQETPQVNAMSSVSSAVQKVGPATVRVDTETEIERAVHVGPRIDGQNDGNAAEDEDGDEIFGGVPSPMKPQRWQYVQQGQGSGIIISEDGLICTNAHVIEGATRVYVTLTDGRRFPAEVKGTDEIVDIAVLKIIRNDEDATPAKRKKSALSTKDKFDGKLPVAELADSDSLEVGNFVVAIGSPGGLDNTVTMGIVSGLKRSSEEVGLYDKKVEFIQTDAAINMGNSGGPLVDVVSGKVIGINTCMRYNMEGTSFAVPTNKVKSIMNDLAQGKQISHGYVGIYTATLTPEFAREKNADPNSNYGLIPEANGVIVLHIYDDTPASAAGLRRADVITEIGGKKVGQAAEVYKIIDSAQVGSPIDFKIIRGDKRMTIKVKPDEFATRLRMAKEQREKKLKQKMDKLKQESLQDKASALPPDMQDKVH
jgi:S1-C subfamily serine protease